MRRTARIVLGVLLALVTVASGHRAPAEDENPSAAPIRAILLEDDAGLRKVYDGIRKGLEFAQLPRVQLERLADSEESFAAYARQVAASPPPLLFLVGRRAAARAIEAKIGGPRVFVDTALALGKDEELPAAVQPDPPAAVVRGLTPATRWTEVVRGVFPILVEEVRLAWEEGDAQGVASRLEGLVGPRTSARDRGLDPAAWWWLRAGVGERLLAREGLRGPLFSDDLGQWGKGAAVLLLPDHRLVGRTAAEAGRRLLGLRPAEVLRMSVGATEIRVDLDAARAAGLEVPLPFAASADVLRGERSR